MADFNEYKGVWVFCEQRQGALMSTDFELVSEARKLADELGCEVTGLLLGDNVEGIAKELGGYGADKVMVCDSPLLKDYTTDAYAKVVCDMVNEYKPEVLLIGATNIGRDLGPRCAARLHTGLTADATHLDIDTAKYVEFLKESSTIDLSKQKFDYEDRNLKMTRPAFGGHLMATIICPRFRPQMSTVRPGVMKKAPFDQAKADACQIVKPAFSLTADDVKTEVLSVEKAAEKLVDLIGADVIVSVGRGISKDVNKGIELAEQLAAALRRHHVAGVDPVNSGGIGLHAAGIFIQPHKVCVGKDRGPPLDIAAHGRFGNQEIPPAAVLLADSVAEDRLTHSRAGSVLFKQGRHGTVEIAEVVLIIRRQTLGSGADHISGFIRPEPACLLHFHWRSSPL
jgi:electron transfer flavoprotein alpha subunit